MNKAIYFFLTPEHVSRDNYGHNPLVIAEGLRELGWQIYANINYWREEPDSQSYLFRHDPSVRPSDCAINVLTYEWAHFVNEIPYELSENTKSIRVYTEDAESTITPGLNERFRMFDFVLRSHFNRLAGFPTNYTSWPFGLSKRIIRHTSNPLPFAERRPNILVNFGATHNYEHPLRLMFEQLVYKRLAPALTIDRTTNRRSEPPIDPYNRLMWEQTSARHYPDYYERLCSSVACSCVGGQLVSGLPADWSKLGGYGRRSEITRAYYHALSIGKTPRLNQWETWRFWESMAAGCVCVMLDFEKYGVQLPIQPKNWIHYIGLDLDHIDRDCQRMRDEPHLFEAVGKAGRGWVLEHYTPQQVASLFLSVVGWK